MPQCILRVLVLSVFCAGGAFGQIRGSFGQIAYGGNWQTTFTLVNTSLSDTATVRLSFFGDNGLPLFASVQSVGVTSDYMFQILPGGVKNLVLSNSDSTTTQGWARMIASGALVTGQGSFRFLIPNGSGVISEAAVPLSLAGDPTCVLPLPQSDPIILVPFDNTTSQFVTSLAFVNTNETSTSQNVALEFYDQSNHQLVSEILTLPALAHSAFVTTARFPALAGKAGILRVHASASDVTVLGLLSNRTGAISTIIPVHR